MAASIYLAINATWSLSPSVAYLAVFSFVLMVIISFVASSALWKLDGDVLRALAKGLYAGVTIGGGVVCFEVVSEQTLRTLLMHYMPSMRPSPRDMTVGAEGAISLAPYLLNRSIASLTLLLWPGLLVTKFLARNLMQHKLMLILMFPAIVAILFSGHESSKLAFIGGVVIFFFCYYADYMARNISLAAWVAAIVLVVPLVHCAYVGQMYRASWLFSSAQSRIVIWGHTSQQVLKAPLLGAGIASARAMHDPDNAPLAPGSTHARLTTGLHSHNAYLQVWYETGAVGATFLLVIGVLILRVLETGLKDVEKYLLAVFGTSALLAAASFSLWAPWVLASLGLTAAFTTLGAAFANQTIADFQGEHRS